jgi:vancomycin resistance protein VanJ
MGSINQGNIVTASIYVYALALIIWVAGRAYLGDQSIYVLALNYLGVWLFFPLVVFIPWVLFNQDPLRALVLLVPVFLFLRFYGTMFIPKTWSAGSPQTPVTIMTFNLQCSNGNDDSILSMLESHQPEVLALQEVTKVYEENLVKVLAERYAYHAYYKPAGLAIYSQHPILSQEILPSRPWAIQSAVIQVGSTPFQLFNGHLAKPGLFQVLGSRKINQARDLAAARVSQIDQIMHAISQKNLPAIVACDGNMTDLTSSYAQITANLQDAFKERGWGLGHTFLLPRGFEIRTGINLPFQRIDYLFYSPQINVSQVKVVTEDTGSDHRPLWAQFDLNP